jgi:hypothetical protein
MLRELAFLSGSPNETFSVATAHKATSLRLQPCQWPPLYDAKLTIS